MLLLSMIACHEVVENPGVACHTPPPTTGLKLTVLLGKSCKASSNRERHTVTTA